MSAELTIEGFEELEARFTEMNKNINTSANSALKKGGKVVLDEVKNNAKDHVRTGKLLNNLDMSGVKNKDGEKYVEVGLTKSDNSETFYGKFLEWGTSKQKATPFIEPAVEKTENEVFEVIKQELIKGLG